MPWDASFHALGRIVSLLLLLLMVVGTGESWAAEPKDFDLPNGYYFLGNEANNNNVPQYDGSNFSANFYMCPAYSTTVNANNYLGGDGTKPLITTFKGFPKNGKTYLWAIWYIEAATGDNAGYFYIRHRDTQQYLVANDNTTPTATRRRVNLGPTTKPEGNDGLFKIQSDDNGVTYYIYPKEKHFVDDKNNDNKYLSPANGNKDYLNATTVSGNAVGGILGFWYENTKNSAWHFVNAQCATPTIIFDKSNHSVTISTETTGATVYYTSGSDPTDPTTSSTNNGTSTITIENVTETTVFKAIAVMENRVNSSVVSQKIVPEQTISLEYNTHSYTGIALEPTVTITGNGETVPFSNTEYNVTYTNNTNAGTATVTITNKPDGTYYIIGGTMEFEITKVPLTITANNHTITYGDAPASNGVIYEGFVNNETVDDLGGTLDYVYSYTQYGDVGNNYTITPKGLTSGNYNISYVAGTLTVNPKALTITAEAKSKFYGDDDPALTYTFEGLVGSDAITGALSRDAGENVGTYPINQNTLTASSNYTISYTGADLTINPKPLTITAKSKTITYGEEPTNDGVTYSEFAPGEDASDLTGTLTYAYNYSQYGDAGSYTITPSGLTSNNYDITYHNGTLIVNPKEVVLTWSETTSFVYDANSHVPTATVTGMVNGDEIGVTVSGEQINAGDHIATASALTGEKADNYALPVANTKSFSITPVALAVTAKNHIIIYGDTPGNNGVEYSGFVGEDNASMLGGSLDYAYSYAQYGDVGDDYTITPSGLTSTNYIISYHNGTLTVKKKTLGLNWTNTSFTYDREEHLPTVTIVGMVNGDEVSVTVTGPSAINAGDYIATASNLSGDKVGNYRLPTVTTQTFTISPKSLGDGDLPAEDITIKLTSEGELEYVKDGEITLTADDYTYEIHTEGSDQIVAVTGIGNYTGTLRGIYAKPKFYDVDGEGAGKAAAVYMSSRDINTFEGVNAYTVKSVNTFLGLLTVSKLEYIPKGVPVLLLSESEATGFVVSEKDEEIADISERTVNNNLLKMADADIPVETAQAYMFYLGEFVLTKAGTIKSGKFYILNPDYTDTSAGSGISSARRSLTIVEEEVTGMTDIPNTGNKSADDVWYTLDGRCLNGKPARKGLYIHQGRKTVIK